MIGAMLLQRLGWAGGPRAMRSVASCAAVALAVGVLIGLGGCGSNGSSSVSFTDDPQAQEKITGVVYGPNGALAALAPAWWERQLNLSFSSPAYGLQGVSPIGAGLPVSLSLLDAIDFADGRIDSPKPLVTSALTDEEGRYSIIDPAAEDVTVCRKVLAAGSGTSLTRALVFSHNVQIDAASEALVRVLLDHVSTSLSPLCNYSVDDLARLLQKVQDVTVSAHGDTAGEINDDAYLRAKNNRFVQQMLVDLGN
ncbi:MAG: hypothetical protein HY270_22925 [Deltaproteobacteria bacterium]|nr:hypothetical protein [Deltaproteobacteria bacterium]